MWLATLATATAGETPMKISSGVIRNPPPCRTCRDEADRDSDPNTRKTLTGKSAIGRWICTGLGVVRVHGPCAAWPLLQAFGFGSGSDS